MPPHPPLTVLPLVLCLLTAPAAAGGLSDVAAAGPAVDRLSSHARSIGDESSPRPTPIHPVRGLHASAFSVSGLGVWAEGTGFSLTRRTSLYDLQGGAAWSIDDGVRLTASYRMLGVDLGYDSDLEGIDLEPGIAAPFLGLAFDF